MILKILITIINDATVSNAHVLLNITFPAKFWALQLFNSLNLDPFFKIGRDFRLLELFISKYFK